MPRFENVRARSWPLSRPDAMARVHAAIAASPVPLLQVVRSSAAAATIRPVEIRTTEIHHTRRCMTLIPPASRPSSQALDDRNIPQGTPDEKGAADVVLQNVNRLTAPCAPTR